MASVKQQHYRRLMKEQKTKASSKSTHKVDHPLAKYNSLDQLSCLVCGMVIKSDILWASHLASRKHKDAVALLKNKKSSLPHPSVSSTQGPAAPKEENGEGFVKPSAPPTAKRKHQELEEDTPPLPKKPRPDQPSNNTSTPSTKNSKTADSSYISTSAKKSKHKKSKKKSSQATSATASSALPSDFFDSGVSKTFRGHGEEVYYESSSESEGEGERETVGAGGSGGGGDRGQAASAPPPGVPPGFFDRGSSYKAVATPQPKKTDSTTESSHGKGKKGPKGSSLPEGFFDDPKLDAKARKVEYKDPMTEEWDKFQKTIQKEDDVSEALQLEEDEEANEERELTEVNEQVSWFTKAEELRQRQEKLVENRAQIAKPTNLQQSTEQQNSSAESDDEELDFDSLLNWRAKVS